MRSLHISNSLEDDKDAFHSQDIFSRRANSAICRGRHGPSPKTQFWPAIYGDGTAWGTKATATLRAPNEHNARPYDKLFVVTNGAMGQLPVAEAAPGNPLYNGGRWFTHTAIWTEAGSNFYMGGLPVLTSFEDIDFNADLGYLLIVPGSPAGGPPPYFECPLLPMK